MSKVFWIILVIIIGAVFGYGAHLAYGEVEYFEDVIRIPIPDDVIGQEKKAKMTVMTDDMLEFTVTYRFYMDGNFTQWREEILLGEGIRPPNVTVCPERFYLDEDGVTCYPITDTPVILGLIGEIPPPLKRFIVDRERFDEDPPTKISEKDYYEKLKFLQMCYRQTETNQQSLGVTQTDGFAVSNLWIENFGVLLKSYDLTGSHAVLDKAIEECKYIHTILNPVTLGAEYQNRAQFYNTTQAYHGDLATDVPIWTQDRVNQESNDLNEPSGLSPICEEDSYYSELTKKMYCGEDYVTPADDFMSDKRLEDMCNSSYVLKSFKKSHGCTRDQQEITCNACEQHDPTYETEELRLYADYKNNGDGTQLKMMKQKIFAEKLKQLREE